MNNENELHDVTFKIRYPSKKGKIIYAVKSILIDELTIHAANEHEQLLLFYPNFKSTKIYVIHKSDDSKCFELGCLEKGDDEKLGVPFYDGCDNKFDEMIAKMKGVDKAAEDYRFTIFYDPDSNTYWIDNSLQLFFENQEAVITTYLKENGYHLTII